MKITCEQRQPPICSQFRSMKEKNVCVCEQRKAQEKILFSICVRLRYVSIVCFSAQREFSVSKKPMKNASKNAHGSVDEIVNKMIELMNVSFGCYLFIFVGFPSFIRVKFQLFCMRAFEKKWLELNAIVHTFLTIRVFNKHFLLTPGIMRSNEFLFAAYIIIFAKIAFQFSVIHIMIIDLRRKMHNGKCFIIVAVV